MVDSGISKRSGKGSYIPTMRVLAATLGISSRVLLHGARGRIDNRHVERLLDAWSREVFVIGKASLDVQGLENLERDRAYVVMSNHGSLVDIPSVVRAMPGPVRMVSKAELAKVPVFGAAITAIGTIIIDRGDREKAIAQLRSARTLLDEGTSMWIAPEGTRSRDGLLGPFKKGGFHVAIDLAAPILPTFVHGASDILPAKTFRCSPGGRITVRFGAPIETEGMSKEDLPALMAQVRHSLLELARDVGSPAAVELETSGDEAA